ncbi:hypothetical protein Q4E40_08645 [Pontibacter sp. BT731]|jgi:hypothetical protein|uniref:hypothetical protein n=1 Tax=Pontibacter coccineus TaxID=3063328 RepID=UPI0026E44280|nr:hypothetical protein [Pontibacter sp. BT731]MDO6390192.1 hypothetical protein [Pontibacter sp. BT731]
MAESSIGDQAIEFLGSYYAKHEKKSGLLVNRTVSTHQGTFADALFAYQKHDNSFFAVSLSTSASDKIARVLSSYKKRGLGRVRYLTAASIFGAASYACYLVGSWLAMAAIPAILAVAGFVLHSRFRKHYIQQQLKVAVDQLKQQPGDHQWLGIQVSSLCWRGNAMADYLSKLCERKGVGLLTIGKRSRLTLRQEPRLATCRRTDFLSYYTQGESLRRELSDQFMRVA